MWVTNVGTSDAAVLWPRLPDGNIGSVVLELDADGVEIVGETENVAGHTQTHFAMEAVHVPAENVLITERDAWREQLARLTWDRVAFAMWTNAVARRAIERAVAYAETREQFGQPIGEFQGLRWKIAELATTYEAGRGLIYRAIRNALAEDRVPTRPESSMAKSRRRRTPSGSSAKRSRCSAPPATSVATRSSTSTGSTGRVGSATAPTRS
jgi:alkylation response protein AidB-like acyl-CoA dehydrogenase